MIEMNPIYPPIYYKGTEYLKNAPAQQVKNEFAAMFYKEILKQSFKSSGDENTLLNGLAQDFFVEKMAEDLAAKNADFLPNLESKTGNDKEISGK